MCMADFSPPSPAPQDLGSSVDIESPPHSRVCFGGTLALLFLKALSKNDFVPWRYVKLAG